ncbi:MAG TPA: hypothetical protein VFT45_24695 [Longimicrobium sp.]|nr:hypothetical protein [Longimicrobium sp.]
MMNPGARARWSAAALLALAACGGDGDGGQLGGDPRLRGGWAADFKLASPLRLTSDSAAGSTIHGEVLLMENRTVRALPQLHGAPTHYGTYGADFRGFGLPVPTAGRVPTIAARISGADSVEMVMEGIGSGIVLTGRMEADTIAGRWSYAGDRAGGAQGTFVLRRPKE